MPDNKLFWKSLKPFISNKRSHRGILKLVESNKLLQDDREIAEELNIFSNESVSTLDINENSHIINPDSINITGPIEKSITSINFIQVFSSLVIRY